MYKKLLFSTALALLTCSLPAQARDTSTAWSGLYVGGFGGFDWTNADVGTTIDVNGGDYGAFVGYQMENLFSANGRAGISAAIEAHYGWSDADDLAFVGGIPTRIEKNHEWGISFRPGLSFVSDTMALGLKPYAILGYRRAEFNRAVPGASNDEEFNGFDLGIGSELVAYKDFGLRVEYSHVFYAQHNGIDPDENDLRAGVVFHF